jgi:Tol biopolymer transport system component
MNSSINRFLNIRAAYGPRFSSDGRKIAFIADIGGVPQVWQVEPDFDSEHINWPEQLTFSVNRVMDIWFSPQPGDNRLIYAQDVGGDENAQLYLLSGDGADDLCLTDGHEQALHTFGDWSADGRTILFATNRRETGLFDIYLQDLDGQARMVWQNEQPGFLVQMIFAPDGQRVVINRMISSFQNELLELDLGTGAVRSITPSADQARYLDVCYAADGRSLYLHSDLNSNYLRLVRLDLVTLSLTTLVAPEWDSEYLAVSTDG